MEPQRGGYWTFYRLTTTSGLRQWPKRMSVEVNHVAAREYVPPDYLDKFLPGCLMC